MKLHLDNHDKPGVARRRQLILHADDLGMSPEVNAGIIAGFQSGLLTSTSLLTNAPAAKEAIGLWQDLESTRVAGKVPSKVWRAELGDDCTSFDLGVHFNLTQGRPLTGKHFPRSLLDHDGHFIGIGRLATKLMRWPSRAIQDGIRNELAAQYEWLCSHGVRPSHANGHQYVEMLPTVTAAMLSVAKSVGLVRLRCPFEPSIAAIRRMTNIAIPASIVGWIKQRFALRFRREIRKHGLLSADNYFGTMHAGCIDAKAIRVFLELGHSTSTIEIGLHPAIALDKSTQSARRKDPTDAWYDPIALGRGNETRLLTSEALFDILKAEKIQLGRLSTLESPLDAHAGHNPRISETLPLEFDPKPVPEKIALSA